MEDGQKQSVNVIHLRAQDIAKYEFGANRVGAPVMYNKNYKLPAVDKVDLMCFIFIYSFVLGLFDYEL
jgi:hypothetical protein